MNDRKERHEEEEEAEKGRKEEISGNAAERWRSDLAAAAAITASSP